MLLWTEKGQDLQTGTFTLKQIIAATNDFDYANKIGEGGFGPVYKVFLYRSLIFCDFIYHLIPFSFFFSCIVHIILGMGWCRANCPMVLLLQLSSSPLIHGRVIGNS